MAEFESVLTISLSAESLALLERIERLCAEMKSLGILGDCSMEMEVVAKIANKPLEY